MAIIAVTSVVRGGLRGRHGRLRRGSRLAAGLLVGAFSSPLFAGAPPGNDIVASFGGSFDGTGAAVVLNGIWKFDRLAPGQLAENCQATALDPFGAEVITGGWTPARDSFIEPRIEALEPSWITGPASGDVGGGVMSFYDEITGGFVISHFSVMESPVVSVPSLGLDFSDGPLTLDFSFTSNSDPVPSFLRFIVGSRVLVGATWSSWIDSELMILDGPQDYRVPLAHLIDPGTDAIQFRIGVYNQLDSISDGGGIAAAPTKGPAVDKAKVDAKKPPAGSEFERLVPDISQEKKAICLATAFANALSYWSSNGFPQLLVGGATQAEKNNKLRDALALLCHSDDVVTGGKDRKNFGVQDFLTQQKATLATVGSGQPYLKFLGYQKTRATWAKLKANFNQNSLAVLAIAHAKADGTLLKPDQLHFVTLARLKEAPDGTKTIWVANPWGESHHAITEQNKKDAYHKMDVTILADDLIRLDDQDIEKNTAGFEDVVDQVAFLKVVSFYTVSRFPLLPAPSTWPGDAPETSTVQARAWVCGDPLRHSPLFSGIAGAVPDQYVFAVTNELDDPLRFFAIELPVDYGDVQSPPGWSWQPLPALPPDLEGCSAVIGDLGIAWFAEDEGAAIPPGESLDGFGYGVAAGTPFSFDGPSTASEGGNIISFAQQPGPVSPCIADLNHNGIVNGFDLALLLRDWGSCPPFSACSADLDGDGIIGSFDLAIVLATWGPCR